MKGGEDDGEEEEEKEKRRDEEDKKGWAGLEKGSQIGRVESGVELALAAAKGREGRGLEFRDIFCPEYHWMG